MEINSTAVFDAVKAMMLFTRVNREFVALHWMWRIFKGLMCLSRVEIIHMSKFLPREQLRKIHQL